MIKNNSGMYPCDCHWERHTSTPSFSPSHLNSSEDGVPIYFVNGHPIPRWVAAIRHGREGTRISAPTMATRRNVPIKNTMTVAGHFFLGSTLSKNRNCFEEMDKMVCCRAQLASRRNTKQPICCSSQGTQETVEQRLPTCSVSEPESHFHPDVALV